MSTPHKQRFIFGALIMLLGGAIIWWTRSPQAAESDAEPTVVMEDTSDEKKLTMADVLKRAEQSLDHMATMLDDYTARFVMQTQDDEGILGEQSETLLKIQTRFRDRRTDSPRRVYLKYLRPIKDREVIWREGEDDGMMAVYEPTFPMNLTTLWLDPDGLLAMQGQTNPIYEIGLVRLVEQLIERGQQDIDDPEISIAVDRTFQFDGRTTELIQIRREKPSQSENDFSLAEIVIDPEHEIVVQFRSFGWKAENEEKAPLLESYQYFDLKTNVGLTEQDFDVKNPSYLFP